MTNTKVFETGYVNDVISTDIPYSSTFGLTFTNLLKDYKIYMYDWDGLEADDLMTSFTFDMSSYIPAYTSTVVLTNGNFQITLTLEWK